MLKRERRQQSLQKQLQKLDMAGRKTSALSDKEARPSLPGGVNVGRPGSGVGGGGSGGGGSYTTTDGLFTFVLG